MNLLPRPRRLQVLGGTVPDRTPAESMDPTLPAQGYRLRITADAVELTSADAAGAFYGRATLAQLRALHPGGLPACAVDDHPDLGVRGVMLDVSRDKVPTLETVKALVDRLAFWKINELQLYTEHTFAYANHREVWAEADPYTCEEIRELDVYCRERHVTLTPNQNCLGHMERWLRHDRYRHLAVSEGFRDALGRRHPPSTLDPANPESIALVRELLGELLGCFSSPRAHVGLDEPVGLPADRAGEYLDYLKRLRAAPELAGREMLVWGDVIARHPELAADLPDGVTVCIWGYEDRSPFAEQAASLVEAGRPFWACAGTSSWLSLAGRFHNAVGNLRSGAETALAEGAGGYLIADWGDRGHLQYLPVSEPLFAYGAAVSWCPEANRDLDLEGCVNAHVMQDEAGELGPALRELGDLYRRITPSVPNSSALVRHLYVPERPVGRDQTEGLTVGELEDVEERLGRVRDMLGRARPRRPDAELVTDELRTTCALLRLLCRDARARLGGDGTLEGVPEAVRRGLAEDLQPIIERHDAHWLARNRPGGLRDSRSRLENLLRAYEGSGPAA